MEREREEKYHKADNSVRFTGGAVAVRNAKGEVSMEKVRVKRYFADKRPDYAGESDEEGSSDDEDDAVSSIAKRNALAEATAATLQDDDNAASVDRRLLRLQHGNEGIVGL